MTALPFGSHLRAARRLGLYLAFTLPLMPLQGLAVLLKLPLRKSLPRWYHRRCLRILGFTVERRGRPVRGHPRLFVSNHMSYLDIMIIGALVRGSFVAKSEVKAWPLFGWLARLQETVFVARRASHSAGQKDEIAQRLQVGDDLILFPEGTSSNGEHVLPFKSALFAVASDWGAHHPLHVQPVSIAYTKLDGLPMGRYLRPAVFRLVR
jgi:1-acyl-sn-glycerol-3-phosphate acyltransferase